MREQTCDRNSLKEILEDNGEYFLDYDKKILSLKDDIQNNISRYSASNEQVINGTYSSIFKYRLQNIEARYSLGEPVENMVNDFEEGVYALNHTNEQKGYYALLWMTSIGIMLEINQEHLKILYESVKKSHYEKDYILQYLFSAVGIMDKVDSNYLDKKYPYIHMRNIIETASHSKEKAEEMLERYAKKEWLEGYKDFGWHNLHKEQDFTGLWSFESGAISKILGLKDEGLKGCHHYPYDLRHYKDTMVFKEVNIEIKESETKKKSKGKYSPIIPDECYKEINRLIKDYDSLSDKAFYKKYEESIKEIWFTIEDYQKDKKRRELKGFLVVNALVDRGIIRQLDYKENLEDYLDTIENVWESDDVKLVNFDLENDQNYYMYVKKEAPEQLYEVKIKAVFKS